MNTGIIERQQVPESSLSTQEKILWWSLAVAGVGGVIYFGRKWVLSMRSDNEEKKSLDDGSSAAFAKRIKMAFDNDGWWGTNLTELRQALRQIPSKEVFRSTLDSYQTLFNQSMLRDMTEELSSSEYNEMMQIVAGKPDKLVKGAKAPVNTVSLAKRLKAAFDKTYGFIPGTDTEAIKAVFSEIPTQTIYIQVGVSFFKEYGKHLADELKKELGSNGYYNMMKIITSKPKK
ncbi:MAG: hypothetical protein EWV91_07020 [Microcystis aeruginosa Ma_QC_Ca_00000000_S207]|uniref:Uncharacterized protein n=1 Tax=Microcystis aeruginosa Ma_QC_Ca_00000000_S207 TaxID=2486251 RepID=A0A552FSV4_MICAE|nr:MAG: hypothetical protein EWV91_07020 [Microcystis aeruginosa Ma_QC_Ca_00000000_S207]